MRLRLFTSALKFQLVSKLPKNVSIKRPRHSGVRGPLNREIKQREQIQRHLVNGHNPLPNDLPQTALLE
jgi:hypothetical protein